MSGPTEFTLESVRQYMLAKDGRVTNHELVKYFKAWLTHPTEKELSRQKFKEYVNTLATIKQESGEKYLVLKKKFYPNFEDDEPPRPPPSQQLHHQGSSPSLLDEVMAGYQSLSPAQQQIPPPPIRRVLPPTPASQMQSRPNDLGLPNPNAYYTPSQSQRSSYASMQRGSSYSNSSGSPSSDMNRGPMMMQPPPYRPPPPSNYRQLPPPNDFGLPVRPPPSSNYGLPRSPPSHNPYKNNGHQPTSMPYSMMDYSSSGNNFSSYHHHEPPPLPRRNPDPPASNNLYNPPLSRAMSMGGPPPPPPKAKEATPPPPPLPVRNSNSNNPSSPPDSQPSNAMSTTDSVVSRQSSMESDERDTDDKENSPMSTDSAQEIREKISVKERTKTFNRMASEVDMNSSKVNNNSHNMNLRKSSSSSVSSAIKRRNSRAAERRASSQARDDKSDSSSINTVDQNLRQWMVKASQGDYHSLTKMLREDPRLAKHQDFTSGFTALHWAAKHGNLDMVKLLAGHYHVDVNGKSHGGYTPLHLACQFSRQDVFDLLVKAYGADPRIRDNHGKTPRQYMMAQEQNMGLSLSSDTFRQLKDRRRSRREASEKNPSILRFGSLSVKVKKTTEAFNNYFGSERKTSWHAGDSATNNNNIRNNGSNGIDSQKMPPPKFAPIKKRKSKQSVDYGKVKSAPTTPTERSPKKDDFSPVISGTKSDESDSEFGFDSQWT